MKRNELKEILKPLIKECIKEVIFEDGVLSGLITEVAQGLGSINASPPSREIAPEVQAQRSENVLEAKNQLNEMKASLQKASGLQGIFEGTTPMPSRSKGQSSKYGVFKDKDPSDAGVNIDGLIKMTGGWSHLTK